MSGILLLSIGIRLVAFAAAVALLGRIRDWRLVFLAAMIGLMATRQSMTLLTGPMDLPIVLVSRIDELPGLAVSLLAFAAVFFLRTMLIEHRDLIAAPARSELLLRGFADVVPAFLTYISTDLRIQFANKFHEKLFGAEWRGIVGRKIRDVMGQDRMKQISGPMQRALAGQTEKFEIDFPMQDGTKREFEAHFVPDRGAGGEIAGFFNLALDITERKKVHAALSEAEDRYRLLVEVSPDAILVHCEGNVVFANPAAVELFGVSGEEDLVGKAAIDVVHSDSRRDIMEQRERMMRTGESIRLSETKFIRPDGSFFYGSGSGSAFFWDGRPSILVVIRDYTEQIRSRDELQLNEERLRRFSDITTEGILVHKEGKYVDVSKAAADMLGYEENELVGRDVMDVTLPAYQDLVRKKVTAGSVEPYEAEVVRKDGTVIPIEVRAKMYQWGGERLRVACIRDISERKQAEKALRESEARFRTIADASPFGILISRLSNSEMMYCNDRLSEILRMPTSDLKGRNATEFYSAFEDRAMVLERVQNNEANGLEIKFSRADGEPAWASLSAQFMEIDGEKVLMSAVADITERKRVDSALKESEERFRGIFENSPSAIFLKDISGKFEIANRRFSEWYGIAPEEVRGKTSFDIYPGKYAEFYTAQDREVVNTGEVRERELDVPFADGVIHTIIVTKFPVSGSDGQPIGVGTIGTDVTEQRRAEEQLRHAQKLEAIGQLTGGVAHDFNNLLAVILGNLDLVTDEIEPANPLRRLVDRAVRAAERGATLTQRLLAFSRKQPLQPSVVDLNQTIADVSDLLHRTLGEAIEISTVTPAGLWQCHADASQLENAFVNLAVNARDAMKDGGSLSIETANVSLDREFADTHAEVAPGDYVMLAVTDSGAGISSDIIERVFEPFFTTKDVGEGSGLGLSMVYGFAKQSGGHVSIESTVGKGTTVCLYLPRTIEIDEGPVDNTRREMDIKGRGETILVVEDDADVRGLAVRMLDSLGYDVLQAGSAAMARTLLEKNEKIDLILTDVVLPGGTGGSELAEEVRMLRPAARILFMSGYADGYVGPEGNLPNGGELLQKPFRRQDLARMVRDTLDARTA